MVSTPATLVRSLIGIGKPGEQPALAGRLLHQRGGVLAGAVEAQRRQRVDLAVDLGDALFQHVEQVERGNFARLQLADDGTRRLTHQLLISHFALSVRFRFLIADGAVEHFPAKWNALGVVADRRYLHDDIVFCA